LGTCDDLNSCCDVHTNMLYQNATNIDASLTQTMLHLTKKTLFQTWHVYGASELACANETATHGPDSYCGSTTVGEAATRWSNMQDWVDAVGNATNPPCPCSGTQSCLTVTPADDRFQLTEPDTGDDLNTLCYTVTPAMIVTLEQHGELIDPQAAREPHTHIVKCTQGEQTWMRHGGKSYCGWATGGYLKGTAMHAAVAADAREPAVLAALVASEKAAQAAEGAADGGGGRLKNGAPGGPNMGVRSIQPGVGMPCGKLDRGPAVTPCPPIEGMVCRGNPVTKRGVCVISERDNWVQHGCLAEYSAAAGACKAVKLLKAADGQTDVQMDIDCSMRHADESAPAPEWHAGAGQGGGSGGGGGGGARSGCDVLRPDEFLEFKYTHVGPGGGISPYVLRLTMQGDGNLVIYVRRTSILPDYPAEIAPFEAVASRYDALDARGIGGGRFVNGYSAYHVDRPPYHARLTPRALELVNGLGRVYYEVPMPSRFDPARPVFVRFQTITLTTSPDVFAALLACGVPRGVACRADDPGCRAATVCEDLHQHT
jgi:hypothetical protein